MSSIIPDFTAPAIVRHTRRPIPGCLVQDCTKCCRISNPDGTPNVLGPLHQAQYTQVIADGSKMPDCAKYPVHPSTFTALAKTASQNPEEADKPWRP